MEHKHKNPVKAAIDGMLLAIKTQLNMRFHTLAALVVIAAGSYFQINHYEWIIVIILICLVMAAELLNTAIEFLCNHLHPSFHESIGKVKDLSAGAVLIVSIGAGIGGLILFIPYIRLLFL